MSSFTEIQYNIAINLKEDGAEQGFNVDGSCCLSHLFSMETLGSFRQEGQVDSMSEETIATPTVAPTDPRLKVLKKFKGKFLPKGVLRDRHKAIMTRWESADQGGVTVEELKKLLDDWRGTREKPPRIPQA